MPAAVAIARRRRKGTAGLTGIAVARAEWLYRNRRRRGEHLPMATALFGEPAFDLLLDLFVQGERGRSVPVALATASAAVPAATALRWIGTLVSTGLVEYLPGAQVPRLRLSEAGRAAMLAYLDDW